MDALIDHAHAVLEGEIDFSGQRLAEGMLYGLLSVVGAAAFLAGFVTQDIYHTLYLGLGGTAVCFLLVVPPWPFFNRHPQSFLPARAGASAGVGIAGLTIEVDGEKVG